MFEVSTILVSYPSSRFCPFSLLKCLQQVLGLEEPSTLISSVKVSVENGHLQRRRLKEEGGHTWSVTNQEVSLRFHGNRPSSKRTNWPISLWRHQPLPASQHEKKSTIASTKGSKCQDTAPLPGRRLNKNPPATPDVHQRLSWPPRNIPQSFQGNHFLEGRARKRRVG